MAALWMIRPFEPVLRGIEPSRLGNVSFTPQGIGCGPLLEDHGLNFTLGAPFEDTIAALRLVLAGVISRYPEIRVHRTAPGGNSALSPDAPRWFPAGPDRVQTQRAAQEAMV